MLSTCRLLTYDQHGGGNPQSADGCVDNHENVLPIGYLERRGPINVQLVSGSIPQQLRRATLLLCELGCHIEIYLIYFFVRPLLLTLEVN